MDLFDSLARDFDNNYRPLAEVLRPRSLDEFLGQSHLVGPEGPLRKMMERGTVTSMILWGPPGSGKTTLARLLAASCKADFVSMSAVSSGVAEVKKVIERAHKNRQAGIRTILFIDEIHRFNKAQQDALLHAVEDGTLLLIGATTENPSFEVISPLLSRCRVYRLHPLSESDLEQLTSRAVQVLENRLQKQLVVDDETRRTLLVLSGGDARELLNALELCANLEDRPEKARITITREALLQAVQQKVPDYDKGGDAHYDTISAFIKSLRGSDPDAALHYLARMLESGEEPRFIARRLIIFASEDVGNADPMALPLAVSAFQAVHIVGMPEAQIVLAQATTYLASAPKSNASYLALQRALEDVRNRSLDPIPLHLRNAPTALMKGMGYGKEYRYPHDFPGHFVRETYLPENLRGRVYYRPSNLGQELDLLRRLQTWWPERYTIDEEKEPQRPAVGSSDGSPEDESKDS